MSDCLYLLTKLYTCEVKLKIEDAVHHQFTMMRRDIELNRIDDMIIEIDPNLKISVGSHPEPVQFNYKLTIRVYT